MFTHKKLIKILKSPETKKIDFDDSSKIVLFSDLHRGYNNRADAFSHNKDIVYRALEHYHKKGFTYIEIGDGDDLWKNRKFENIGLAHKNIFDIIRKIHAHGHFHFVWGNHNMNWRNPNNVKKHLQPLLKDITAHEGIILRYSKTGDKILVVHGHQGQLLNDIFSFPTKIFIRGIWKNLQLLGFTSLLNPTLNFRGRKKTEKKMKKWAQENKQTIIMGHTHIPCFPASDELYFNTGSCIRPHSITGIEIEKGEIKLVRWTRDGKNITREIAGGPEKIKRFF